MHKTGSKQGRKRKQMGHSTKCSERVARPDSKYVLEGLDRDWHSMVAEDAELVQQHKVTIRTAERAKWEVDPQHSAQWIYVVSAQCCSDYPNGMETYLSERLGVPIPDAALLPKQVHSKQLVSKSHWDDAVIFATRWLCSYGVRLAAPLSFDFDQVDASMATLSSAYMFVRSSLLAAIVEATADVALPVALLSNIVCEYILPVSCVHMDLPSPLTGSITGAREGRVRVLVETMFFDARETVCQSKVQFHGILFTQYLAYRRQAAAALDDLLQKQHGDRQHAIVVVPSRSVRRRKGRAACGPGQSTYDRMEYRFFGFLRTGRHSWTCSVEGRQILDAPAAASNSSKVITMPLFGAASPIQPSVRKVRLRQLDLDERPWCLMCLSPNIVLSVPNWTVPTVPRANYWYHATRTSLGIAGGSYDIDRDVTRCFYPPPDRPQSPPSDHYL